MAEKGQQTTALSTRSMGDQPGNLMSVRELYDDIERAYRFAKALAMGHGGTEKDAATAFGKIITGAEIGIPPAAAVRGIHFIKGQISMSADLMVALAKEEGWSFKIEHSDPPGQWCKVTAEKEGEVPYSFCWTYEMAQQAGLTGGDNWKKYPWDMLYARCAGHVSRKVEPGRMHGMYAPQELEDVGRPAFDPLQANGGADSADSDHLLQEAPEAGDPTQQTEATAEPDTESNGEQSQAPAEAEDQQNFAF